jgi:hypothetical protein
MRKNFCRRLAWAVRHERPNAHDRHVIKGVEHAAVCAGRSLGSGIRRRGNAVDFLWFFQ